MESWTAIKNNKNENRNNSIIVIGQCLDNARKTCLVIINPN